MGALDPRVAEYAKLLVERSLGVQPGWQVLIRTQPEARPVVEELIRLIAKAGAYPILRMNWTLFPIDEVWAAEAPAELVGEMAPIDLYASDHMDARITIEAPDNTRGQAQISADRRALMNIAQAPFFRRTMADEIPWVGCQFPTNAFAQEAGMPLSAFEDLVLRGVPARLGCRRRADAALLRPVRCGRRGPDRRRGNGSAPVSEGAEGRGRRRPREHARRRVLLLAERGLGRGNDPVRRPDRARHRTGVRASA